MVMVMVVGIGTGIMWITNLVDPDIFHEEFSQDHAMHWAGTKFNHGVDDLHKGSVHTRHVGKGMDMGMGMASVMVT